MNKINVATNHKAGRVTQVMMEQFADFAVEANNKLIDKVVHTETKVEQLHEVLDALEQATQKVNSMTMGPHLKKILKILEKGKHDLAEYVKDIEKHRAHQA